VSASYQVRDLPQDERPRERLARHGAESLSSAELLAIILGSGTKGKSVIHLSQELLSLFGSLPRLSEATLAELQEVKGLGPAKALQLKAAISLGVRAAAFEAAPRMRITTPSQVYNLVRDQLAHASREHFMAILLDTHGQLIRCETISIGTLNETLVHPREVFHPAIRHKASSLILVHNHPSGDLTPSKQDFDQTSRLVASGKLLNILVMDHLIVGASGYCSMRDKGADFE
jgi:DNA repair protein RadC